jgi:hypothetical protein
VLLLEEIIIMPTKTKICDRCHRELPATDRYFDLDLRGGYGFKSYCRDCSPAVAAERRQRKREKSKEWTRNNPEKVKATAQRTYEEHRAERLAYLRRYRQENKDRLREYQRAYLERKKTKAD